VQPSVDIDDGGPDAACLKRAFDPRRDMAFSAGIDARQCDEDAAPGDCGTAFVDNSLDDGVDVRIHDRIIRTIRGARIDGVKSLILAASLTLTVLAVFDARPPGTR